ncbi:MAG TPA: sensor histidine kinase [Casimicrobiaceae bacterium]|nr:sensor histidine kinase [Casimicrobiaceae bacterium]
MPDRRASIRRRLLLFLIPSLLILVVGASAVTYFVAAHVAQSAYDRALLDPVLDMAANVTVDASGPRLTMIQQAQEALLYDHEDTLIFQIRAPDGAVVAGDEGLGMPPNMNRGDRVFFDRRLADQPMRVAAVRSDNGFYVQVAETLHKRNRVIWEILAAGSLPAILIALATLALAWTAVARGLAPLASVRAQLLGRSAQDLRPLDEHAAPSEIAPAIEALNRLLARLRESNEMQQRFLANAAHQLRTPLAGLQMHLELLLRRDLHPEIRSEISGMHIATVRASHLANQLLALAKAEATAGDSIRTTSVDLYSIADRAAHEWVQRAIARDIDLGFLLEHAQIAGDPVLLSELLDNLLDNALRYTPQGGAVTVRCGPDSGRSYLSVEDTGPGIPPSAHGRVFERFYRIQGTPGDGTGLGLAIVKEVAQRHGASLHIETPESGRSGTRVVVRFPPTAPQAPESK